VLKSLIIIPAYNEESCIEKVIDEVKAIGDSHEIIVINDGSSDKTEALVRGKGVSIVTHPINLGAGATIQTGLLYAKQHAYDLATVVDGDGQHDPAEVKKLIAAMASNTADVVVGSRFIEKTDGKIHWPRRIGIYLFAIIASSISGCKITDTTSGFRTFNKQAIEFLSREMPQDFPDADMLLSLIFSGYKIIEVPVSIRERQGGKSMYTFLRSVYYPFKLLIALLAVFLRTALGKRR